MKILYLCNEITLRNGWGVINYYTVQNAADQGHDVTVLTEVGAPNLPLNNVKTIPSLFRIGYTLAEYKILLKSLLQIRKLIKEEKYDAIHILVEPYLIYFYLLNHKNIVLNLVGTYAITIFQNSRLAPLYRKALNKVHRLVAISQYTADFFKEHVSNKKEIEVVPLGVDTDTFNIKFDQATPKQPWFTLVGHIKARKGVKYAIEAIKALKQHYPDVTLNVVGSLDGKYATECKSMVEAEGLQENVKFLGVQERSKILELYTQSIGNILPSVNADDGSFEGFGLIHLEANACSILTIGSENCGNESAIVHGETGFLAKQRDSEDLAKWMSQIIEIYRKGEYEAYAKKCYSYALTQDWKNYFQQMQKLY